MSEVKAYISPGKYNAKVIDAGLSLNRDGQPQPFIKFILDDGKAMTWYGSLKSDASQQLAIKNAVNAGFMGDDWSEFSKLEKFEPREISITVDLNDKGRPQVRFINPKNKPIEKINAAQAPKMSTLFKKVRTEMGVKVETVEDLF